MSDPPRHLPVLHFETLKLLSPIPGEVVLDCTAGLGGHASSFAQAIGEKGTLILLDADSKNLAQAKSRLNDWRGTLQTHHTNFREIASLPLPAVDILFADLGLSSPHLDDPARGFSFRSDDAPLDMRFDQTRGETASELLARLSADDVKKILRDYGELQQSWKLAQALAGKVWKTTGEVKAIVEQIFGFRAKSLLPQVFQAIRIAVNDELNAVVQLLTHGPSLLKSGGRMGIISFHSLEDRLVKHAFKALCEPERDPLKGKVTKLAPFELLTPKPIVPSEAEITANPRARSAKLRILRRS